MEIVDLDGGVSTSKVDLPGAGGVLTTGIIAIPFGFGLIGLILAIVTLSRASALTNEYNANPGKYTEDSFRKVKNGKTCAIVSLGMLGLSLLILAVVLGMG